MFWTIAVIVVVAFVAAVTWLSRPRGNPENH